MTAAATPLISSMVLRLGSVRLGDEAFFELCQLNRDLRLERSAEGEILVMPPTGAATGSRNAELTMQLRAWAKRDGTGVAFDSSTGFRLPSGAIRSPDAAWVSKARLTTLTHDQKERFPPLAPDFAAELRSPSDELESLRAKAREYLAAGVRLVWLLDPVDRAVEVYHPGAPVEQLESPSRLFGGDVLPGFELELDGVWQPEI